MKIQFLKKYIIFLFFCLSPVWVISQGGKWTWMNGNNAFNQNGVYGTKGSPASTNTPRALYEPVYWQDPDRCLWIFGGGSNIAYSDLWKFNPYTNQWTWMHGPGGVTGQTAIFGTKGIAAATNRPGARGNGMASWVDKDGNLWLFGGLATGSNRFNDLWKYDVSSYLWTWVSGSTAPNAPAVYGTQGVPSAANVPGARYEVICSWTYDGVNLWLFGGFNGKFLSDLWKYNITTNQWTWMKGSTAGDMISSYGSIGIADTANHPGGRCAVGHWTNEDGSFWLLGGNGMNLSASQRCLSDMWKYDPSSNNWTWVHGPQNATDPGWYKSYCNPTPTSRPSHRYEHYSSASDRCGNLWTYGGGTYSSSPSIVSNKSDLWIFNTYSQQWTWVSGDSTLNNAAVYGTKLVPSITNKPGARNGSVAFIDSLNNFWLFGGKQVGGSDYCNDMWRFTMDTTCINLTNCVSAALPPEAGFNITQNVNCTNVCLSFSDTSTHYPFSWQWDFPGAVTSTSTTKNPSSICYSNNGNYTISLIACNPSGCDTIEKQYVISSILPPPSITLGNDTVLCAGDSIMLNTTAGFASYKWYLNSSLLPYTSNTITASLPGDFSVLVTDTNNCTAKDTIKINFSSLSVDLGKDSSLCVNNAPIILDAGSNGISYQWYRNGNSLTDTLQNLNVSQTGMYLVSVTNNIGCKTKDSVQVVLNPLPVISTISDTTICMFDSIILTTNGALNYTWIPTQYLNNPNIQNPIAQPLNDITYIVNGTDANGCSSSDSVNIIIKPIPPLNLGNDTAACANLSILLDAGNAITYQWYVNGNPSIDITQSITVDQTGVYSVDVSNSWGCISTDSITVTFYPLPAVVTISDTSVCMFDSLVLTTNGALNYTWSPTQYLNNPTIYNPISKPLNDITYIVNGIDYNGCSSSDSISIHVNSLPIVNLGNDTASCINEIIILNAGNGFNYKWFLNGNILPDTLQTLNVTQTGIYYAAITDLNGCQNIDSVKIILHPLPFVRTITDTSLCDSGSVTMTAIGAEKYSWTPTYFLNNDSIAAPIATPTTTTTYVVIGIDSIGCINSDTVSIIVSHSPHADFSVSKIFHCDGIEAEFINKSVNAAAYIWYFGDGNTSSETHPKHFYTSFDNTYDRLVAINNTCSDTFSINAFNSGVTFSNTPNVFTPNGDAINDCFDISNGNTSDCLSIAIFNRWGKKVFESDNGSCWNGRLNNDGEKLSDGVYFFIAEAYNIKIKGTIQLLR